MLSWDELSKMQGAGAEKCGYTEFAWNEPKICRHCVEDLNHELAQAVFAMGTDAWCWDQAVAKFKGYSHCSHREAPKLTDRHCVPEFGVHNSSYVTWDQLSPRQIAGAQTCHYNSASWDGPADCVACFEDLSLAKKQELKETGPDHAYCWHKLLEEYGMDCDRVLTDIPKFADRKKLYAEFLQEFQMNPGLRRPMDALAGWSAPSTLATLALFLLAVSFAVHAVVQLRRQGIHTSPGAISYVQVECGEDDFPCE